MKYLFHAAVLMTVLSYSVFAQADADNDEWTYFVAGYLTAVSIDAKATTYSPAGDQVLKIEPSFSDLLDNMDYGASGIFIARKGAFSLNVDMVFAGITVDESLPLPSSDMKAEIDLREHEFYVGYAAFDAYPELEIITGVRYIDQDISVKITTPGFIQKIDTGDDWIDPFIGLRYMGAINNKWNWHLRGDVGGFDVGSDFAWRVDAGATYRVDKHWEAAIFYKILDIDYETGTSGTPSIFKWDGQEKGITLGVGYHF